MNGFLRHVMRTELRRKRRLLAAALCAASFVTGQMLFGEEAQPKQSRISQYLQAKIRLTSTAEEKNLAPGKRQASATTSSRRAANSAEPLAATTETSSAEPSDKTAAAPPVDFRQALQRTIAGEKAEEVPAAGPTQIVAKEMPLENNLVDEENLPPIIPASAMTRPRPKSRQVVVPTQQQSAPNKSPAAAASAPTKIQPPKPAPWRINLGGKPLPAISVDEPEAPPSPPVGQPSSFQGPDASPASPTSNGPWNSQPNSAAAQSAGAIENPFVSQRRQWSNAPRVEPAMPRALFQGQLPSSPASSVAPPAGREISAAPAPYPMPLEIFNPNVSKRPVALTGSSEPVRTAGMAPPVFTAQTGQAMGEGNPLRPAAKVSAVDSQAATTGSPADYREPGLLVAPANKNSDEKDRSTGKLKQIEAAIGITSEGSGMAKRAEGAVETLKQKSSRRKYMAER